MWIKTQTGKDLVNVIRITVNKSYLTKKKAVLTGYYSSPSLFQDNHIILGYYDTLDDAKKELSKIEDSIRKPEENIYTIK